MYAFGSSRFDSFGWDSFFLSDYNCYSYKIVQFDALSQWLYTKRTNNYYQVAYN